MKLKPPFLTSSMELLLQVENQENLMLEFKMKNTIENQ
jgi:hypothetical protein